MNKCDTCKYAKWEWSESTSKFMALDCKRYCYDKMAIGGEDCKHYEPQERNDFMSENEPLIVTYEDNYIKVIEYENGVATIDKSSGAIISWIGNGTWKGDNENADDIELV